MSRGTGGGRPRRMCDPQNVTIRLDRPLLEAMDLLKKKSSSMTFSRLMSSGIRTELDQLNVRSDEVIHLLEEYWRSEIEYAENQLASLAAIKKRLPKTTPSLTASKRTIEITDPDTGLVDIAVEDLS